MSGIIKVDDLRGPRFAAALELLQEGGGFSFEGVVFRFESPGRIHCVVESSWSPERVSRATVADDLAFASDVMQRVREASPAFATLTRDVGTRFELIHDYGGGSILLASREGDHITLSSECSRVNGRGDR